MWIGTIVALVAIVVAGLLYLTWYMQWTVRKTRGMAYFGRPRRERRALKRRIALLGLPALPLVWLLAIARRRRATMPSFDYDGVHGPPGVSSRALFEGARQYRPTAHDVFVVTQMRCGTTWMQQLVYQVLTRGRGELDDRSGPLYAVSPWIEGANSVRIEDAALVGEPPTRIVKTHLPATACPHAAEARYIYVARHPVSCFASIVDFNRMMVGPLLPPLDTLAEWFCSDRMYWLPWPMHVTGWWECALRHDNVLFVQFEQMKADFPGVRERVAAFLGIALTGEEARRIDEKCSFRYMSEHEEQFEMAPPTMFSASRPGFLPSGKAARHRDVDPVIAARIRAWCRESLRDSSFPASRFYPDLGAGEAPVGAPAQGRTEP